MFMVAAPSAFGTITYGGINVEVPTSSPAIAVGDTGVLNNNVGALAFNTPKMTSLPWPFTPMADANNEIVQDPSGGGAFTKYCRAWVFTGATRAAGTVGDAAAEWQGQQVASANEVLDTGDAIVLNAEVNGQSHSEVHNTGTVGTIATTAQTLIDSWAGSRLAVGAVNAWDRELYGNAQITSTAQTDTQGSASTGATAFGYTGNDVPQSNAIAGFSGQRVTTSTGATGVPGAISGTVTGTTSVELSNANVDATGTGAASGYATVNTYAMASASDLPNTRSYSLSEIRSNVAASRAGTTTAARRTTALATADGTASSEAWDSSRDWSAMTTAGSGNAISSVTGKTMANAVASLTGDNVYGDTITFPAGEILATRSPNGDVWSGMLSAASNGQQVNQATITPGVRDAFTLAYTSAKVTRPTLGSTSAANAATGEAWVGSAGTTNADIPLTNGAQLSATSQETQANYMTSASLSDIGIGSGAHAMSQAPNVGNIGQGSTAKLAARARFTAAGTISQQVNIGAAGGYPGATTSSNFQNGLITYGPSLTGSATDDGGSYVIAGSQNAISTGSSGTYSLTAQSTDVREWVSGSTLLNNNWILQGATPIDFQLPQSANTGPNLQETFNFGRAPDTYQWTGNMNGPA
jgi:hypothetical protein